MQDSKLITILRAFNEDEFKSFETFLASPFFNQSEKLVKFFRLIKPHYPLFRSDKLDKEKLHKALHGKTAYSDPTMRQLISDMFKQLRSFLAHYNLRNDNLAAGVSRYNWLIEHNFEKLAEPELQTRRQELSNYSPHDFYYYHHRWLSDLNHFEMAAIRLMGSEHKLLEEINIFEHLDSLNREYLVNAFTILTYLLATSKIYKFSVQPGILEQVEALSLGYINKGDTVIDMFFDIFQLAQTDDEKYFYDLKNKFLANDPLVPLLANSEAGIALENYCSKKIREGKDEFGAQIMELYRFEVENGFHRQADKMSQIFYFNVAIRGAETGQVDWTDRFIEDNRQFLPAEYMEDSYNFAKAHVLFARKNFRESLRLGLACKIPYFVSKVLIRNLVARTQYELGMLDELYIELHAHRHHTKDEKLTAERRHHLETFITVMKQLADLKGNFNREKLIALSAHVESQKGFANKKWFQEKISELTEKR